MDELDIYNPEKDKGIDDTEMEKKCAVYMDVEGVQEAKCDLLPERIGGAKWVKARRILVKLQNPVDTQYDVDTQYLHTWYLWVKVLPL